MLTCNCNIIRTTRTKVCFDVCRINVTYFLFTIPLLSRFPLFFFNQRSLLLNLCAFLPFFSEALPILARRDCFFFFFTPSHCHCFASLIERFTDMLVFFFPLFHNRFSMCKPQRAIFLEHKAGHKWKELHERYSQWYFFFFFSPSNGFFFFLVVVPSCLSRDNWLTLSLSLATY